MMDYVFRLENENGKEIASSYGTDQYLSFQIGGEHVITG